MSYEPQVLYDEMRREYMTEAEIENMAASTRVDSVPMWTVPTSDVSSLAQRDRILRERRGSMPSDLYTFWLSENMDSFLSKMDKYEASDLINNLVRGEWDLVRSVILEKGFTV